MPKNNLNKSFVLQHDQSECGVACLLSIIQYYDGNSNLERLREISGTTKHGTTLLGLYQASKVLGLDAEGFSIDDIGHLKNIKAPVILHVVIEKYLQHYIICYGYENNMFLVGDPAKGIRYYSEEELINIWKNKVLLTLKPNQNFVKTSEGKKQKKEWFFSLIKEDILVLSVSTFLGIVVSLLSLSTAIFSQQLIDKILPAREINKLWIGLLLLLLLLFIRSIFIYIRNLFLYKQSRDFNLRIAGNFYDKLLILPKSFFDGRKTGDLIARMNDTRRIQGVIIFLSTNVVIDLLTILISFIVILFYSYSLALLSLIGLPLFGLLVWKYNSKIIKGQKEVMSAFALSESNYVDTITGISTIKLGNKEPFFSKFTTNYYGFFQSKFFELSLLGNKYTLIGDIIQAIALLFILSYSSWMVLQEQLQLGELVAILGISSNLINAIAKLTTTNIQLQEAFVALNRMYEYAGLKSEYENSNKEKSIYLEKFDFQSLSIQDLSFRFPGRTQLLKSISMLVKKGELIAILGESGCGKTTLFQILEKFYVPEKGQITINDFIGWDEIGIQDWRKKIGVVPQEIKVFNGSLLFNIILNDNENEIGKVIQFCERYGFNYFFELLPQGYNTLIGEEGINLSGGQKQLLALVRAMIQKPQLLLLDEATAAMDRNTEKFILNFFKQIKDDIAVIIISHKPQIAQYADRIYILENGLIKDSGSPRELLTYDNFYTQSWIDLSIK